MLHWCSVLNPDYLSIPMLEQLTGCPRELLNRGIREIRSFSLIKRFGDQVSINRMTQNEICRMMGPKVFSDYVQKLGRGLKASLLLLNPGVYVFSENKESFMHAQWLLSVISKEVKLDEDTCCFLHEAVGEYHLVGGNLEMAKEHLEQAVENSHCNEPVHLFGCIGLAFLYEAEGYYEDVRQVLETVRAAELFLKQKFPVRYFKMKLAEVYLYDDMLMADETVQAVDEASRELEDCKRELPAPEAMEHSMELANIKGHAFLTKGNFMDAEKQYREVIRICEKNEIRIPSYGYAYYNLAHMKMRPGESNKEAILYFLKAGEVFKKLYGGADHPDIAMQLTGLGWSYMNRGGEGDTDRAARCFQDGLEMLVDRLGLSEHPFGMQICMLQAMLFKKSRRFEDICQCCDRGLEISERAPVSKEKEILVPLFFRYKIWALYHLGQYENVLQILKTSGKCYIKAKKKQIRSKLLLFPKKIYLKRIRREKV